MTNAHHRQRVYVYRINQISPQDVSATTTPSAVILTQQCMRLVGGEAEVCVRTVCTTPQGQSVTGVPRATSRIPAAQWAVLMPAYVSNTALHTPQCRKHNTQQIRQWLQHGLWISTLHGQKCTAACRLDVDLWCLAYVCVAARLYLQHWGDSEWGPVWGQHRLVSV